MTSQSTNIVITGHQDLRAEDTDKIQERIIQKLDKIMGGRANTLQFRLLHGRAVSADTRIHLQ